MNRLQLLDYGRFFAAVSVVIFHYFFKGIHNGKISSISYIPDVIEVVKYGYLGVYFFFMISGYVIFFSAENKKASDFAVSRVSRLYPAFWTAILFTSTFAIFWGGEKMSIHLSQILANFTMAAPLFGQNYVDGVYWTLVYELNFYFLVFTFLLFRAKKHLVKILLFWPFLIALASYFNKYNLPYLDSYYSYFSAGAILAIVKSQKTLSTFISLLLCLFLCIHYSTGEAAGLSRSDGVLYSKYVIGTIVATFFVFFAILNTKVGSNVQLRGSKLLGGLTYPIYLIHAHFGYMFISQFGNEENKIILYLITIIIILFVAYSIHVLVEKRYSRFWKLFFFCIVGKPVEAINLKLLTWINS